MATNGLTSLWKRVMTPGLNDLNPAAARVFLKMRFNQRDRRRIHALSMLAQRGRLTEAQAAELDMYLHLGSILGILHSKSRMALQRLGEAPKAPRKSA